MVRYRAGLSLLKVHEILGSWFMAFVSVSCTRKMQIPIVEKGESEKERERERENERQRGPKATDSPTLHSAHCTGVPVRPLSPQKGRMRRKRFVNWSLNMAFPKKRL